HGATHAVRTAAIARRCHHPTSAWTPPDDDERHSCQRFRIGHHRALNEHRVHVDVKDTPETDDRHVAHRATDDAATPRYTRPTAPDTGSRCPSLFPSPGCSRRTGCHSR